MLMDLCLPGPIRIAQPHRREFGEPEIRSSILPHALLRENGYWDGMARLVEVV